MTMQPGARDRAGETARRICMLKLTLLPEEYLTIDGKIVVQLIRVDPDDSGALPDDPGRSNCSGFSLGDEFLGGNG